jgi:hypothetical protein
LPPGHGFAQELQPLGDQVGVQRSKPRHVAARAHQTVHEAGLDRIRGVGEHDRNRCRRLLDGQRGRLGPGDDQVGLQCDELGREPIEPFEVPFGVSPIDRQVAPLDPAALRHLPEQGAENDAWRRRPTRGYEHSDAHRAGVRRDLGGGAAATEKRDRQSEARGFVRVRSN